MFCGKFKCAQMIYDYKTALEDAYRFNENVSNSGYLQHMNKKKSNHRGPQQILVSLNF